MEKVKELVIQHQDKFKFALFGGIGIAAFNCFVRADYNLILYIYVYYIWNMLESRETQENEKVNCFFVLGYSLIVDLVWVIYWGSVWGALKVDDQGFIHGVVKLLSWLGILLKIVILISIGFLNAENIKMSLPAQIRGQSNYVQQQDDR